MLSGQLPHGSPPLALVGGRRLEGVAEAGAGQPHHATGHALRHAPELQLLHHDSALAHSNPFFVRSSCRPWMAHACSATKRLSLAFSDLSNFSRWNSGTLSPWYLRRQW